MSLGGAALATAFVAIRADTSGMATSIRSGTESAVKAGEPAARTGGDRLGQGVGSGIHGGLGKWKGAIVGLTASLGVVGLLIEVKKFAGDAVDAYGNLAASTQKLSTITGASAQDSSRLISSFQMRGIAADQATKILGLFSKQIYAGDLQNAKYNAGLAKATAAHKVFSGSLGPVASEFKNLGIATTDAQGKQLGMTDILKKTADAFEKMPNGVDKAALAQKLFGKQGLSMLPFLNQGAAGVTKLMEESDKLGTTLSGSDLAAVKANTLAKRQFGEAMEGVAVTVGRVLFPVLTILAGFMVNDLMPAVMLVGHWLGDTLGPIIGDVSRFVTAQLIPAVMNLVQGFMVNVLPALKTVWGMIAENLLPALQSIWQTFTDHIIPAIVRMLPYFEKVAIVIGVVVAAIVIIIAWIIGKLVPAIALIIGVVVDVVSHIAAFASDAIDHFGSVVDFVKKIPGWIATAFGGIASILTAPFRIAFDAIKALWNATLGGFHVDIPSWIPLIGGKSFSVPKLAAGAYVPATPGGMLAVLGEGAYGEVVTPVDSHGRALPGAPTAAGGGDGTVIHVYGQSDPSGTARAVAVELEWSGRGRR